MQSSLVYVVPKWTEICARDFKEGSERLCEVIIEGEIKIYNFDAFTDETYHRLYDRQPNRLEDNDIKPENKIWIAIHQQMTELESFQQFSNRLNGDEFLAGIGTTAICKAIAEMLPEPDQRLEDPELIRKQIRGIFEMLAGQPPSAELMQMVQGLKQKGIATRKACEDYADSITETKIGTALIIGIARAEADLEIMEESLAALGGGGDRTTEEKLKVADKLQLAQRLQAAPKLQAIAQLAGKKIAIAAKMQRSKVIEGRTEMVGVTTGNDLTRLLPCELIKLTESDGFLIHVRNYLII